MDYLLLADITTAVHTIVILIVLFGILISVWYKRFRPIEAFILIGAVIIWSLYHGCPLTYLENYFRTLGGAPTNILQMGFIPYYAQHWFNVFITSDQLNVITYTVATIFFVLSFEWMKPITHLVLKKRRKK